MSRPWLTDIFSGLEKSSDKWALYLRVYESLFAPFRDRALSILEIGVQNGGFTEVLAAYFSNAECIVGCDIDEKCGLLEFSDPRISLVVGDASDSATIGRVAEISDSFGIVIDDGSHTSKDIIATFCRVFPMLREDGVYVVEDVHCSYWFDYEGGVAHPYSSMSFFKLLTDVVNYEHWGVEQPRGRLVSDLLAHHGCEIEESELGKILSVEFLNSMIVVRKMSEKEVLLGERLVTGKSASVADNYPYNHTEAMKNDQSGNPFSDLELIGNKHVFNLFVRLMDERNAVSLTQERLANEMAALHAGLAEERAHQAAELQSAAARFAAVSSRIDELAAGQEQMTAQLAALVAGQAEATNGFAAGQGALAAQVEAISAAMAAEGGQRAAGQGSVEERIAALASLLTELRDRSVAEEGRLTERFAATRGEIGAAIHGLNEFSTRSANASEQLAAGQRQLTERLNNVVENLMEGRGRSLSEHRELVEQLTALNAGIGETKRGVVHLIARFRSDNGRFATDQGALAEQIAVAIAGIDELRQSKGALEKLRQLVSGK